MSSCRLYLVTPPKLDPVPFAEDLAKALDAGDVACVQLRLKDVDDDTVRRAIDVLRPVAQSREVAFILNDRPDIAAQTGCDGAHVGQEDMPYEKTRKLLGPQAIVGVTCHDSRHLAMEAAEKGADYVAFGAFFETTAKEPKGHPTPDILYWWNQIMTTPVVAIGGIFPHNLAPLVEAGADFVAVISAVFYNPDGPAAGVRAMNKAIADAPQPAN